MITSLKDNQVFVFGSNEDGFHGGGAAAQAFLGTTGNWRNSYRMQRAIEQLKIGNREQGEWAIWGQARGFMQGKCGKSYAIATVKRPGGPKLSLDNIYQQVVELLQFANLHPEYEFMVTAFGVGLAGFSEKEMDGVWYDAMEYVGGQPKNVIKLPPL